MGKNDIGITKFHKDSPIVVGSFFNGLQIPSNTEVDLYQNTKDPNHYLLHGENSTLEYNGVTGGDDDSENEYVVAVYDAKSKQAELFQAPMVHGRVTSLASRVHKGPRIKSKGARVYDQRVSLGQQFGTKKAKAAIANVARNRIDADKLEDMEMDIVDNVKEVTSEMPSRETMEQESSVNRVTPPAHEDATAVEDIYPLHEVVPMRELKSIRVNGLMEESSPEARLDSLPYTKSALLAKKLNQFVVTSNADKLQLLYYVSLLMGVYTHRRAKNKESLMGNLGNKPSELLVDGILDRFTARKIVGVGKSKDKAFFIDTHHEDKLVCYLIVLMMHLDGFMVEMLPLAKDLNMKPSKLNTLLRAIGAYVHPVSVGMAEGLGLSKKEASTYKVAELRVPFKAPQMVSTRKR